MVAQDDEAKQVEGASLVFHLLLSHASQARGGKVRQVSQGNSKHSVALPRPLIHQLCRHRVRGLSNVAEQGS